MVSFIIVSFVAGLVLATIFTLIFVLWVGSTNDERND